jgi:hypothetical protein
MAAEDITDQVTAWALDEVSKQCMGEHFGVSVSWAPAPLQTPAGAVMVPAWMVLITTRNPLVGEGDLFHMAAVGTPRPKQDAVRTEVADGIRQLRALAKSKLAGSKLAGSNGKPPELVTPG